MRQSEQSRRAAEYQHGIEVLKITLRRYEKKREIVLSTICPNSCNSPCIKCFQTFNKSLST